MPDRPESIKRSRRRRPGIRALATVAGLTTIAALAAIPAAEASAAATYFVSSSASPTGTDGSCTTAAYSTIQSAVTAAEAAETTGSPVPVIEVCPGTYSEQLTITKSLVIDRAPVGQSKGPVVIELPASVGSSQSTGLSTTKCQAKDSANSTSLPQSVIEICGSSASRANTTGVTVSISHVTVEGNWPNSVCYDSLYDVLVGGGATLVMTDSVVEQAGAYPLNGCQGGVGIQVGYAPTGQIGHADLSYDTIDSYQKNGITVDGRGSTAEIGYVTVTGDGPTSQIAQNGIQISFGATGSVTGAIISGNNYTGSGEASSTGILIYGGGGSECGIGATSPLSTKVSLLGNALLNNDIGVDMQNLNADCNASPTQKTDNTACDNTVVNFHGYSGGVPSADANISGFGTTSHGIVGDQAGIADSGDGDTICDNTIEGAGYSPRDTAGSLPNPALPAWVRPIDVVSFAAPTDVTVTGNTFDGKKYNP
jgi:hypothetical protein